MDGLLLGIDLGTSSIKVALYTTNLKLKKIIKKSYPSINPSEEIFEQQANDWWKALIIALREIRNDFSLNNIEAIGLSGFNAVVGVSVNGQPAGPAITYLDKRPISFITSLLDNGLISEEYIFKRTCNRLLAGGMWAPILSWINSKKPQYWNKTDVFLSSSGFIASKLTGEFGIDNSRASLTLLHDPVSKNLSWDMELCELFNINITKLPPIQNSWEIIGKVIHEASKQTGLPSGIPVIIGGMDSMCAALGSGINNSKILFDIGGSAGGLATIDSVPRPDPRFLMVRYIIPGYWSTIGPLSAAGIAWNWFKETLGAGFSEKQLIIFAKKTNPGSDGLIFVPHLIGSRSPHWDTEAKASFQGITNKHKIGHFTRSILEGIGFALREIMLSQKEMGYSFMGVRTAGGGSKNDLFLQIKADILGLPYITPAIEEASSFGASLLAAYGVGIIKNITQFTNKNIKISLRRNPSQKNHEIYSKIYESLNLYKYDKLIS